MESYKKILVVGGAGYIGGLTVDRLLETSGDDWCHVRVYDNLLYEDRYFKDVAFIYGDIQDVGKVINWGKDCDAVVLLGAIVGDPACNVNPALTEKVNYEAVKNICEKLNPDVHVVFMSTCSVYGANEKIVDETSETKPLSCYASTKLRAEKHVLERGGTVFRLGTVYGVGDKFSRIRADLVVNTLTIKAFTKNEITVNGGKQWRPIISVKDIAGYIIEACQRKVPGLFNLAYKNITINDIADIILKVFPDVKVNRIGEMFQDERNYKVSTEKADSVFLYRPTVKVVDEVYELHTLLQERRIKDPQSVNYINGLFLANKRL